MPYEYGGQWCAVVDKSFELVGWERRQSELKRAVMGAGGLQGVQGTESAGVRAWAIVRPEPTNRNDPKAVEAVVDGLQIGWINVGRLPWIRREFKAAGTETLALDVLVVAGYDGALSVRANETPDSLVGPVDLERRAAEAAKQEEAAQHVADLQAARLARVAAGEEHAQGTWVVSIDGDSGDFDDDFDPVAFRKRVARARQTGGNLRMKWEDDWSETYAVTPGLEIVLEFDSDDGDDYSTSEILNGPGSPN